MLNDVMPQETSSRTDLREEANKGSLESITSLLCEAAKWFSHNKEKEAFGLYSTARSICRTMEGKALLASFEESYKPFFVKRAEAHSTGGAVNNPVSHFSQENNNYIRF